MPGGTGSRTLLPRPRPCLPAGRHGQSAAHSAALGVHPPGQGQHAAALLAGDGDHAAGEHPGHVFQRQALLACIDHVLQPPGLIGVQPAAEPDNQAVQPPGPGPRNRPRPSDVIQGEPRRPRTAAPGCLVVQGRSGPGGDPGVDGPAEQRRRGLREALSVRRNTRREEHGAWSEKPSASIRDNARESGPLRTPSRRTADELSEVMGHYL